MGNNAVPAAYLHGRYWCDTDVAIQKADVHENSRELNARELK